MEIKIGIQHVAREVSLETNSTGKELLEQYRSALAEQGLFTVTDEKGRTIAVPATQIGYLDLGSEQSRKVGFGTV